MLHIEAARRQSSTISSLDKMSDESQLKRASPTSARSLRRSRRPKSPSVDLEGHVPESEHLAPLFAPEQPARECTRDWRRSPQSAYRAGVRDVADSEARRLPPLLIDLAAGREPRDTTVHAPVVNLANEHRLTGLLWTWAREHLTDAEPKTALAQNDLSVQAHLVRVWQVLEECVARLAAVGIEVATIKGVTAEARWYGRRGERPCSDVDLLLSPHQLDRAAEAVGLLEPDHPWLSHVGQLTAAARIQAVTTHVDGLEVDVHLDLLKLGIPTRQSSDVWARTSPYLLPGGGMVRVLDDTTALIHLLLHLNKDRFQRLLGYADVARVIAGGRVDWGLFARFVRNEGITVSALRTLEVVLEELSLPWPPELARPRSARARLWNVIWPPGIRLRGTEGRLRYRKRQAWIALLARGRCGESLRWWLRDLWPPAPVTAVRYATIPGPYLWKLFWGRVATKRSQRERLTLRAERTGDDLVDS